MRCLARALIGAAAFAALTGVAQAEERLRIDPDHTFVHFAVLHTGVSSVRGRFAVRKGSAVFDPAAQSAEVSAEIDIGSVDTGVKKLDAVLVGEQFFDTARYRTARFQGKASRFTEGLPVEFSGELTIKDITRPVQLRAQRFTCKQVEIFVVKRFVCGGDLVTSLKRSDFGMSKYLSMVGDEVELMISVEAIRESR